MPRITAFFSPVERPRSHAPSPTLFPSPKPTKVDGLYSHAPEYDAYSSGSSEASLSETDDSDSESDTADMPVTVTVVRSPPRKRRYIDKRLPDVRPLSKREKREQKLAAEDKAIKGYIKELDSRLQNQRVRETVNISCLLVLIIWMIRRTTEALTRHDTERNFSTVTFSASVRKC
jgi:hypothetical protein